MRLQRTSRTGCRGTGTRKRRSGQPFRVGHHSRQSRAFRLYEGQRLHPGALQKFGSLVTRSALADPRAVGRGSFISKLKSPATSLFLCRQQSTSCHCTAVPSFPLGTTVRWLRICPTCSNLQLYCVRVDCEVLFSLWTWYSFGLATFITLGMESLFTTLRRFSKAVLALSIGCRPFQFASPCPSRMLRSFRNVHIHSFLLPIIFEALSRSWRG